jgi:transposase
MSTRAIVRQLRVSPKTVRRALRSLTPPVATPAPRGSIVDPFERRIEDILARTPTLTAARVLEELRREGFKGGYTVVKKRVRRLRPRRREAFIPLRFEPGEAAQVDWASCGTIRVGAAERRLSCFLMVLCWSRLLYVEFTLAEGLAEFLRCHVHAFRFLGGVPRRIVYDNLRSVVLARVGADVRPNPRFLELAGHYLFKPDVCRPRRPNEKGRVENAVGYLRESFLEGRTFGSLAEVDIAARRWRDEVANVRLHGTTRRRPIDLFAEEKPLLLPVPAADFDADTREERRVSSTAQVQFDGNAYSTPTSLVGESVVVRASAVRVRVTTREGAIVADHERSYERGREIENPEHRTELLVARRRAEESVGTRRFLALGPEAAPYLKGLVDGESDPHREVRRILGLVDAYGATEVLGALVKALEFRAFGADYLARIVVQERRRRDEPRPAGPVRVGPAHLADVHIPPTDLAEYDRLLTRAAPRTKETPDRASQDAAHPSAPEPVEEPARAPA